MPKMGKRKDGARFSYVGHIKHFLIISGSVFLVGLLVALIGGVKLDINFRGGSRYTFSHEGEVSASAAADALRDALGLDLEVSESRDYQGGSAKLVVSATGDELDELNKLTGGDASSDATSGETSSAVSSDTSSAAGASSAASGGESSAAGDSSVEGGSASSGTGSTASETGSTASGSGSASSGTSSTASEGGSASTESEEETVIGGAPGIILDALRKAFPDAGIEFGDSNTVSPVMAAKFFGKCFAALAIASALLLVYIALRFRKIGGLSAGVMSLVALLHDLIVAFIACVVFRLEIDMNFVAVVLTILGYSLNDTIVVYDRIRENRKLYPEKTLREVTDESLLQVTNRTITTSVATFIAVFAIFIVAELNGLTTLRTFTIPMALGIISGSYSSLCLAAPLWVLWNEHKERKKALKPGKGRK